MIALVLLVFRFVSVVSSSECVTGINVDSFEGFSWFNDPVEFHLSEDKKTLTVLSCENNCDYWRKSWYGFIHDDGPFFYRDFATGQAKNITMMVTFEGEYVKQFDQSGLMIRLDENFWLKTGIEFEEDCTHVSAVVTNEKSDWSVVNICDHKGPISLKIFIDDDGSFEILFSLDGLDFQMLRIGSLPIPEYENVKLGVMTASPTGKAPFKTVFKNFQIRSDEPPKSFKESTLE